MTFQHWLKHLDFQRHNYFLTNFELRMFPGWRGMVYDGGSAWNWKPILKAGGGLFEKQPKLKSIPRVEAAMK